MTTAIALLGLTGVASAVPPVPATTTVTNLSATAATLNGTVNPSAAVTNVTFQYDDDSSFGSPVSTPLTPVPAGPAQAVSFNTALPLTTGTPYYFRIVADNGDAGGPVTSPSSLAFVPSPLQDVTNPVFSNLTSSSFHVSASVTPYGAATQARFRYGTSPNSQQFTPVQTNLTGSSPQTIQADLTGLPAFTRIYYTLRTDRQAPVAANAIESPVQQSVVTDRALTGISAKASRVTYSGTSTISGTVTGAGTSGVNLTVLAQPYPYTGSFAPVLDGKAASNGSYSLRLGKNLKNTKIQVVTTGSSVVASPITTLYVETRVGLTIKKKGSKRVFTGTVRPKLGSSARAKVQRKSGKKWVTVRTLRLTEQSSASSRYTTTLSRRKNTSYRVQVSAGTSSYATGVSTTRKVK